MLKAAIISFADAQRARDQARNNIFHNRSGQVRILQEQAPRLKTRMEQAFGLPVTLGRDDERNYDPHIAFLPDEIAIIQQGYAFRGCAIGYGVCENAAIADLYFKVSHGLSARRMVFRTNPDSSVTRFGFDKETDAFFVYTPSAIRKLTP